MEEKNYGSILLRYGLSIVFLWFGLNQILSPTTWIAWLPHWVQSIPMSASLIIIINGTIEVLLGSLLALGFATRFVAFVLGIHLFGIALTVGYNDIGIRDFGLSLAVFSIALHGPDAWCIDRKIIVEKPWWRFVFGF